MSLFVLFVCIIKSNRNSQFVILHIKMEPLKGLGELYFQWQGVALLS